MEMATAIVTARGGPWPVRKEVNINEMFYDGCDEPGGITAALGEDWLKQCTCALL